MLFASFSDIRMHAAKDENHHPTLQVYSRRITVDN